MGTAVASLALFIAPDPARPGADGPPGPAAERQFAFWVGDWDIQSRQRSPGGDAWVEGKCINHVRRILNGRVIEERFDGSQLSPPLSGLSVSAYNRALGRWQQTWVDDEGNYLDFIGGWQGDRMVLSRTAERGGRRVLQRMVWQDITPDRLTWTWESSADGGKTWRVLWELRYTRRKS
jgi:hypothetical protein